MIAGQRCRQSEIVVGFHRVAGQLLGLAQNGTGLFQLSQSRQGHAQMNQSLDIIRLSPQRFAESRHRLG